GRGRPVFPAARPAPPLVTFHYGFSTDLGGGEYERAGSFTAGLQPVKRVSRTQPADFTSIQAALKALVPGGGVVEVADSDRYQETLALDVGDGHFEVRAADKCRPTLVLADTWSVTGTEGGELTVNGLLISGDPLSPQDLPGPAVRAGGALGRLRLRHCTLVPGVSRRRAGGPQHPGAPGPVRDGRAAP